MQLRSYKAFIPYLHLEEVIFLMLRKALLNADNRLRVHLQVYSQRLLANLSILFWDIYGVYDTFKYF